MNIVLTGFMATGKTTIGSLIAERLGWKFIDTDAVLVERAGLNIPEIFEKYGEEYFRQMEAQLCEEIPNWNRTVVATGGGIVLNPINRRALNRAGIVINLSCSSNHILERVGDISSRPLLNCEQPKKRIEDLLGTRSEAYHAFPFQLDTSGMNPQLIVEQIMQIFTTFSGCLSLSVNIPSSGGYSILLGSGAVRLIGNVLKHRRITPIICVLTDSNVQNYYLSSMLEQLRQDGFTPFSYVIDAGESSKNLDQVNKAYSELARHNLDRRGAVIALGGGVIGDLAGFVAATYMRGVAFVQCPTSLLAMVDSSVGGKTGVDLPEGKNLVGSFKQPLCVLANTDCLNTLPYEELLNGIAETIKHGIIADPELFSQMEQYNDQVIDRNLIAASIQVKIRTVEQDPMENGVRANLNLGHTIGHALEMLANYQLPHGQAVAAGLAATAILSQKMGILDPNVGNRIRNVLTKFKFPIAHRADPKSIIRALKHDKKTIGGEPKFVLIQDIGKVKFGCDVPVKLLRETLEELRIKDE